MEAKLFAFGGYVPQDILRTAGAHHLFTGVAGEEFGCFIPKKDFSSAIHIVNIAVQAGHQLN
jgi:hypothetical protein